LPRVYQPAFSLCLPTFRRSFPLRSTIVLGTNDTNQRTRVRNHMELKDIEPLRRISLLAGVDDAQLGRLGRGAYLQRFPKGIALVEAGDQADFLHVLLEGAVELVGRAASRETIV